MQFDSVWRDTFLPAYLVKKPYTRDRHGHLWLLATRNHQIKLVDEILAYRSNLCQELATSCTFRIWRFNYHCSLCVIGINHNKMIITICFFLYNCENTLD